MHGYSVVSLRQPLPRNIIMTDCDETQIFVTKMKLHGEEFIRSTF